MSKALEEEQSRRYATMHGIVSDLERFLFHAQLRARPQNRRYPSAKDAKEGDPAGVPESKGSAEERDD